MPEFRVRRDDLSQCEVAETEPREDLADGEAQLEVERFALTTNNVTYGQVGDLLGYWDMFPAPDGWGRIPAWGYARVDESRSPLLDPGARLYGFVPMASSFTIRPEPHPAGVLDAAEHRAAFAPVYRQYLPVEGDGDDALLIMRPLFATAVLLDLDLEERASDGAGTVVVTSASAKTAYGLAHLLRDRPVRTAGLTSPARRDWVSALGLYDEVLDYEDLDGLEVSGRAVLVDFAGNAALLRAVHERLGDALARSIRVGFTHRDAEVDGPPPPGPAPEFFFAPQAMAAHGRELVEHFAAGWATLAPVLADHLRIERVRGADELLRVYRELLDGRADPAAGFIASLADGR